MVLDDYSDVLDLRVGKYGLDDNTEGKYARTDKGVIGIIVSANSNERLDGIELKINDELYIVKRDSIVKIKNNIRDILEPLDFVNEMQIDQFDDDEGNLFLGIPIYDDACMNCIEEVRPIDSIEIRTILTKEQYEMNSYTVEV